VLGVVLLRERTVDRQELRRAELEPTLLEARQDLAGELALNGIGLDQNQSSFGGQFLACAALRVVNVARSAGKPDA